MFSVVVAALCAALVTATAVGAEDEAEPNMFTELSCTCDVVPSEAIASGDPVSAGIKDGLAGLPGALGD